MRHLLCGSRLVRGPHGAHAVPRRWHHRDTRKRFSSQRLPRSTLTGRLSSTSCCRVPHPIPRRVQRVRPSCLAMIRRAALGGGRQTSEGEERVNPFVDDLRQAYQNSVLGNAHNRGLDSDFALGHLRPDSARSRTPAGGAGWALPTRGLQREPRRREDCIFGATPQGASGAWLGKGGRRCFRMAVPIGRAGVRGALRCVGVTRGKVCGPLVPLRARSTGGARRRQRLRRGDRGE